MPVVAFVLVIEMPSDRPEFCPTIDIEFVRNCGAFR
jgi:hypothetical protein